MRITDLRLELSIWAFCSVLILSLGFVLDPIGFAWLESLRSTSLDSFFISLTEQGVYFIFGSIILIAVYRICKNTNLQSRLIPAVFSLGITGILVFLLKALFERSRPFLVDQSLLVPLVLPESFSFPSGHTATVFSLLIPFWRVSKIWGVLWFFFALLVSVGRVYEHVHYPSDIAGGIVLGGMIGALFSHSQVQFWIRDLWENNLEFRRQSFHFFAGFLVVFLHWADFLRLRYISVLLLIGLVVSWISTQKRIPFISPILATFDRPRDQKFPGRGLFYFCLAIFLTLTIFSGKNLPIAYAVILILSVGDALNHLDFGRPSKHDLVLLWNRKKRLKWVLFGLLGGALSAQFFVPFPAALLATTVALIIETIPWRIGRFYLDDNLTVPISAGIILWTWNQLAPFL